MALGRTYRAFTTNDLMKLAFERLSQAFGAVAGTTQTLTSTDTAQSLPDLVVDGAMAASLDLSVETANIRIAYKVPPTQAGLGHLVSAGEHITINNPDDILSLKYISATASTPAKVVITPRY